MPTARMSSGGADEESIDYQIRIEAAQALQSLETVMDEAANLPDAIQQVEIAVQALADKFGISFGAAQKEMANTIVMAEKLRKKFASLAAEHGAENVTLSPYLQTLGRTMSPFGELGDAAGWKMVNDLRAQGVTFSNQEAKSEATTAAEVNKQVIAKQKALDIDQQEQVLMQKEADAIAQQYKLYGQVSRTTKETADYLTKFASTQQGQSILTKFIGDYKQVEGVKNQIGVIKNAISELSTATGASFSQAGKVIEQQFSNIPGIAQQSTRAVRELNKEFDTVKDSANKAVGGIDAVRIALGAIVAMIVFQVIQAISNAFHTAIENATQLEQALYRLQNVERILSMEGVEISMKGLEEGITRIKKLLPIFSREDIAGLVGQIAIGTKELGFTEQQIIDLSQAIAILNVRSAENETLQQTTQKVMSSLITGNARGIAALGVAFTENAMTAEAMKEGLLKAGESLSDLTDQEKGVVKLNIVLRNTGQEVESLSDFMESNTAKIAKNKAAWNDLLTFIGQQLANLIPDVSQLNESLQKAAELASVNKLFTEAVQAQPTKTFGQGAQDLAIWFKIGTGVKLTVDQYERLKEILGSLDQKKLQSVFPDPSAIKDRFTRELVQSLIEVKDTATDTGKATEDAFNNIDWSEFKQKVEDVKTDLDQGREDLAKKLSQKQADLDLEYQRKSEDAYTDLLRKREDINKQYELDLKKIKDKQREQDLKDEEKYQLQLWELRMRFLMDLEDALHARDARQIIRLQKQYALDKQILEKKHALDNKDREEAQRDELNDAKDKRDRALADAQEDYNRKLADQRVAKQRELDDLNVWYAREQADLELAAQRKLQTIVDAWAKENELTAQAAAKIYEIIKGYFGPGGLTDGIYAYMNQSLVANAQAAMSALGSINQYGGVGTTPYGPPKPTQAQQTLNLTHGGHPGRAEGGSIIANRPTTVTFGERGAEAALFMPMTKLGSNAGRVDLSGNMGGGMNGQIVVQLDLSPDLEARVTQNTMDGVASVITKINRSKV